MKTKEFIKAIKKLGYYPLENNTIIKIAKSQSVPYVYADVATKYRNIFRTDYFPFTELTSEKQAELLDVLIEYARTPLEEREEEKVYYIPLPHLETSDGIQQVLSKLENGKTYFASRPNEKLKQRYTQAELAQVPEVYKPFAKPIEEEEE